MIELRPTSSGDLPGLSALFEARFGHPFSPEEWEWKYRRLPGEGRSLVAAGSGGEVLAHAGALQLPARWQGGEAGVWQLADFVAAPRSAAGLRPPLVALGRLLLADLPGEGDVPFLFGFPSERHFRLGERVFGYRPLLALQPLAGDLAAVPSSPPGVVLESGDTCGPWAEEVWEACAVPGVRRSTAFLNWRYHARPGRYYRVYRLSAQSREGLAVFAFVGREAWAAELWLPPGAEWYPSMLAVAADLRAAGLGTWRFWPRPAVEALGPSGPPPAADPLLAALGLLPEGEPRKVGCRPRPGCDPAAVAAGFTFSMGDYDLV
jgi:hypothetical protein